MRHIFITGCAKSGTTMLLGLFHAFDFPCIPMECTPRQLLKYGSWTNKRYGGIVGKRSSRNLFSWHISREAQLAQLNTIVTKGIEIVHITRNKEDVLRSENGYVPEKRYDAVQRQAEEFHHAIKCHVGFEDILRDPTRVQSQLVRQLDLKVRHCWTDYPNFVPSMVHHSALWPPRPLGAPKKDYE